MEQGQILKLNEFFVEGDNQELSHVLLHIIQPSTAEEERDKGYFFAICEINRGNKDDICHLQRIIDEIENGYYEIGSDKNKNSLEIILEKINQDNAAVFASVTSLNCAIGTICRNKIHFAYHGMPEIILFYKNKKNAYQQMGLISADEDSVGNANKLFPQIVSGKINPHDYLFIGTARIHDYFSHDRLQKILTTRSPERSAEHLEKVLSEIKNGLSFGGLIINITKKATASELREPNALTASRHAPASKINPLFITEQNTARTLSPSLLPKIKNKIKLLINAYQEKKSSVQQPDAPINKIDDYTSAQISSTHLYLHKPTSSKNKVKIERSGQKSAAWQYFKTIFKYICLGLWRIIFWLTKLLFKIGRNLIMLIIVCFNIKNRRREILDEWSNNCHNLLEAFKNLPMLTKIMGITALAVTIIFTASLLYLQINKNRIDENNQYQATLQLIKNQIDAADSAMIYGDLTAALKEADETKKALNEFVCQPKDKDTCAQINDRINALMSSARKMFSVTPQMLINWSQRDFTDTDKLFKINSKIVSLSSGTSTIFIYNLINKEIKTANPPENGIAGFTFAAVPKENDYALLMYGGENAMLFNPQNNALKKAELSLPSPESNIAAAIIYNRRLYSLDASNSHIYRHDNIKDGFDLGKDWLKDTSLNIRDANCMAIDGDLYVLKNNGEIYKFSQGNKVPFDLQGVDPALSSGTAIRTYTDWKNIYILDNVEKRIIIVDNTGKLVKQLILTGLKNPSDMVVEESSDTAYVLDDNKLYQVNLK